VIELAEQLPFLQNLAHIPAEVLLGKRFDGDHVVGAAPLA